MHTTESSKKIQHLKTEAKKFEKMARIARQAAPIVAGAETQAQARLEDLSVYRVEKKGKKGKTNEYWHATWRHGQKVCNFYLGSCKKLAREQALQKAMKLKAEDLGIRALSVSSNDVSLKMT